MNYRKFAGLMCILYTGCMPAHADDEFGRSRGELLYSTYCIACHTTQVHWRDDRLATDWKSLTKQVRRWQNNAGLTWEEEDIRSVAHYLNTLYYHFPEEGKAISLQNEHGR